MTVPVVVATANKTDYTQGEPVTVTFSVTDAPRDVATPRTITWTGVDGEGNAVSGTLTINSHSGSPDTFGLTSVKWVDTGVALTINGLQATGTA